MLTAAASESGIWDVAAETMPRDQLEALQLERLRDTIDRVLTGTISGGVTVNETMLHVAQDDLPFGGVGPSGMGAYHGIEGFCTFSHAKGVFDQGRWNASNLLRAPFGQVAEKILGLMLR